MQEKITNNVGKKKQVFSVKKKEEIIVIKDKRFKPLQSSMDLEWNKNLLPVENQQRTDNNQENKLDMAANYNLSGKNEKEILNELKHKVKGNTSILKEVSKNDY